ncbi:MAG TPA: methyltransferase [Sphingomonadaceae bacterium]|nr:methyltransferase [Sphingomonadaceae bacterium]
MLTACERAPSAPTAPSPSAFPPPYRPVAKIVSSSFSNEDARDALGEAEMVMGLAGIAPGMSVADIGAGDGYYTIRLSPLVGPKGRVLAQDIIPETRDKLARRVDRERLSNVSVRLGLPNDPKLPPNSFDRVLLIHMYHEIAQPAEFLWHLRGSLKPNGSVVVVDAERPTANHGTPRALLICEFRALGYTLTKFEQLKDGESYFAQFAPTLPRPRPRDIPRCAAKAG